MDELWDAGRGEGSALAGCCRAAGSSAGDSGVSGRFESKESLVDKSCFWSELFLLCMAATFSEILED